MKINNRAKLFAIESSLWVSIFTSIGFLGFFARDLYLAKIFGFSAVLDSFYLAMLIPMFMVSVFCMPFGQAIIPKLKEIKINSVSKYENAIKNLLIIISSITFILCLLSYLISDYIFIYLYNIEFIPYYFEDKLLLLLVLPILFFSGLVILYNSILLVDQKYFYPSLIQLVVPVIALFFIFIFKDYGIISAIFGMLIGQIINLILVRYLVINDIHITPKTNFRNFDFKILKTYPELVIIALFSAILIPMNTIIATSLGPGAVAIYNLGIKFTMFFVGVMTSIYSSVLLPYFSGISYTKGQLSLHRETVALLKISTFVFIPISLLIMYFSYDITKTIFKYIVEEESLFLGISSIIKYSSIQLPFWVFNAIIFRHANSLNRVGIILFASVVIFVLNLELGLFLIKFMDIGGLALSMSISIAIASIIILINQAINKYISFKELILFVFIWFAYAVVLIIYQFDKCIILFNKIF